MQSRLLALLDKQLAHTREPVAWARVQAHRALYYARQGERDDAARIIAEVRAKFDPNPHAEVTAWISLAEALNQFYAKPGPEGMDRLRRAQALARAIQHEELVPLCAAWLAHFEFNANNMPEVLGHAREVLALAKPEHHAAWARISLVLADAYHFAGRFDLAKGWYAKVREHALAQGDDAMTSAMLHNVAAIRTSHVRIADAFGEVDLDEARRAQMEAESIRTYDFGIGTHSLTLLVPLLRAQILAVRGDFVEATQLFESNLFKATDEGLARLVPAFLADHAWCQSQLGKEPEAIEIAESALKQARATAMDSDDAAATLGRISVVLAAAGQTDRADALRTEAAKQLSHHKASQLKLLEQLNELIRGDTPSVKGAASS